MAFQRRMTVPCPHRRWFLASLLLIALGLALGAFVYQDRVVPGELELLRWMHLPPSETLDQVAWWASRLGDSYTGLMAVTILSTLWCAWRGRLDLALFLAVASAFRILNTPIKWLFDSARPPLDLHAVIELADGLGYPSGHTSGAVLVYGAAALAVPLTLPSAPARWAVRLICLVMVLLIPWSRMRLGVHWPSDVAGGYLFGAGLLALLWSVVGCWRGAANLRAARGARFHLHRLPAAADRWDGLSRPTCRQLSHGGSGETASRRRRQRDLSTGSRHDDRARLGQVPRPVCGRVMRSQSGMNRE